VANDPSVPADLPALTWDGEQLFGRMVLNCWRGCGEGGPPDGSAEVLVAVGEEGAAREPTPEQAAALRFLIEQEKAVTDSILQAVFDDYPRIRASCGYSEDEEEFQLYYPDLDRPARLRPMIRVDVVHVSDVAKAGVAYVGFLFDCTWNFDGSDSLGVLTHLDRVVGVGDFSIADDRRFAVRDRDGAT
jgi:Domain of unknown function (DUF6985)